MFRKTVLFCSSCGCVLGITYRDGASAEVRTALAESKHRELTAPRCDGDRRSLRLLTDRPVHAVDREAARRR